MVSVMKNKDDFLQPDAFPYDVGPEYRQKLLRVSEELVKRDVELLKFLCMDVIPASQLEEIGRGIQLFEILETKHKLGPDNLEFLVDCLWNIGRVDLVGRLNMVTNSVATCGDGVSQYRKLLLRIAEDLEKREVGSLIYQAVPVLKLPKMSANKIKSAIQLFIVMEQTQVISQADVGYLSTSLLQIGRPDLAEIVESYRNTVLGVSPPGLSGYKPGDRNVGWEQMLQNAATFPSGNPVLPPQAYNTSPQTLTSSLFNNYTSGDCRDDLENLAISTVEARVGTLDPQQFSVMPGVPGIVPGMVDQFQQMKLSEPHPSPHPDPHPQKSDPNLPCYKMDADPKGYCLIINNEKFFQDPEDVDSQDLPQREGSNVDAARLDKVFTGLGFLVEERKNLVDVDMVKVCSDFASKDHRNFDCFVCCILTHGVKDNLYGANGKLVPISELLSCFKALRCPQLTGKPKLFFFQACQGKDKQQGAEAMEMDAPNDSRETIPNEADFLLGYATVPGFVSYRSKVQGSWYITELCKNLENFGREYEIMAILIRVNNAVSRARANMKDGVYKQIPAPMMTLRKQLYF